MKNFIVFLGQNPRVGILAFIAILNYALKLCGFKVLQGPEYESAVDALSWILGALAVYFASKGKWPEQLPPGVSSAEKKP